MSSAGATPFGATGAALAAVDGAADPDPEPPELPDPDPDELPDDGAALVTGAAADFVDVPLSRATATPPTISAATAAPATPPRTAARFVLRPFGAGAGFGGVGGGRGSDGPDPPSWTVGCGAVGSAVGCGPVGSPAMGSFGMNGS